MNKQSGLVLDIESMQLAEFFRDWTKVQCAMTLPGEAKLLQKFLPFMLETENMKYYLIR